MRGLVRRTRGPIPRRGSEWWRARRRFARDYVVRSSGPERTNSNDAFDFAGLDYAAIGPEHAFLHDSGRAEYIYAGDAEALEGFRVCAELEGIIPALETSHAVMPAIRVARELPRGDSVIVNLSGRGDKDVQLVADLQAQ